MTIRVKTLKDFSWKAGLEEEEGEVWKIEEGDVYDFSDFDAVRLIEEGKAELVSVRPGAEDRDVFLLEGDDSSEKRFLNQTARTEALEKCRNHGLGGASWRLGYRRFGTRNPDRSSWNQRWDTEACEPRGERYEIGEIRASSGWLEKTSFVGRERETFPTQGLRLQPLPQLHKTVKKHDLTFWEYIGIALAFYDKKHEVKNPDYPREDEAFSAEELMNVESALNVGDTKTLPGRIASEVLIPSDLFKPVYRDDWEYPRNRLEDEGWSCATTLFDPTFPEGDPTSEIHRDAARAVAEILARRGYLVMIAFHPTGVEPHADVIGVPPAHRADRFSKRAEECWDWDYAVAVQIEKEPSQAIEGLEDTIDESRRSGFVTVYPVWRREQWYKIELVLRAKGVEVSPFYDLRMIFPDTEAVIQAVPRDLFSPLMQNKIEERKWKGYGRHPAYETALRVLSTNFGMPKVYDDEIHVKELESGKDKYVAKATDQAKWVLGVDENLSDEEIERRAQKKVDAVQEVHERRYKRRKKREKKAEKES